MGRYYRGIFKRGNIYWIRYADSTGKIVRESARTKNINVALQLLAKRKSDVVQGYADKPVIKNYTFGFLVQKYKEFASVQKSFAKTKSFLINELLNYFGSDTHLLKFTPQLVESFLIKQLKGNKAPATANKKIAILKHMFTKAVEWEMIPEDVLRKVRKVKPLKENNRRLRYLSKEEIYELLKACDKHLYPIVFTAVNTGMRKEEILSLKWSNIDLKNGIIHIEKTKNSERRDVPINGVLLRQFKSLFAKRKLGTNYVFVNPLTNTKYKDIKRAFQSACRRAGIDDFHFHDLRHTFASHLIMSGVDLTTVKDLLGHKDIKMTLRYAHLAPEHRRKAVIFFDALFEDNAIDILGSPSDNKIVELK